MGIQHAAHNQHHAFLRKLTYRDSVDAFVFQFDVTREQHHCVCTLNFRRGKPAASCCHEAQPFTEAAAARLSAVCLLLLHACWTPAGFVRHAISHHRDAVQLAACDTRWWCIQSKNN